MIPGAVIEILVEASTGPRKPGPDGPGRGRRVNLAITTPVVATLLAVVFGLWYRREGTLSIHSIVTVRREMFYWLAILLTFALGTAAGDWTLELTGWTPGIVVLLPSFLIAATVVGWKLRANAVLSFWIAYVLTRPLGANLGDWIAVEKQLGRIGVGTLGTSLIFLTAILGTVIYLAVKRPDVGVGERPAVGPSGRDQQDRTIARTVRHRRRRGPFDSCSVRGSFGTSAVDDSSGAGGRSRMAVVGDPFGGGGGDGRNPEASHDPTDGQPWAKLVILPEDIFRWCAPRFPDSVSSVALCCPV